MDEKDIEKNKEERDKENENQNDKEKESIKGNEELKHLPALHRDENIEDSDLSRSELIKARRAALSNKHSQSCPSQALFSDLPIIPHKDTIHTEDRFHLLNDNLFLNGRPSHRNDFFRIEFPSSTFSSSPYYDDYYETYFRKNNLHDPSKRFQYRAEDDMGTHYGANVESWNYKKDYRMRCSSLTPMKESFTPEIFTRIAKSIPVDIENEEEEEEQKITTYEEKERGFLEGEIFKEEDRDLKSKSSPFVIIDESFPAVSSTVPSLKEVSFTEVIGGRKEEEKAVEKIQIIKAVGEEAEKMEGKEESMEKGTTEEMTEEEIPLTSQIELPVIQEFIIDPNFQISVEGRKVNEVKIFFYYLFCIFTLGILYLLAKWFPEILSFSTTTQSPLAYSTHVFVSNSFGQKTLTRVRRSYYGSILMDVFDQQKVHECIVLDDIPVEESEEKDDDDLEENDEDEENDSDYSLLIDDRDSRNILKTVRISPGISSNSSSSRPVETVKDGEVLKKYKDFEKEIVVQEEASNEKQGNNGFNDSKTRKMRKSKKDQEMVIEIEDKDKDKKVEEDEEEIDPNEEDEEPEETIYYSYSCNPSLNPIPAAHIDVNDSASLSSSVLKRHHGEKPSSSDFLYFFEYRCIRFIYHPNTGRYFKNSQWETFQGTSFKMLNGGLTKSVHSQRKILFGTNDINIEVPSVFKIFIEEILHPFNIFQILSVILWILEEYYYYCGTIFFIAAFSLLLTIIETKKNRENLRNMAAYSCSLNVFRDGKWNQRLSDDLVAGDIFELRLDMNAQLIPCDALLLEGDCIINESMLTGESIPVSKHPITSDVWMSDGPDINRITLASEKSVLYCGTKLVRARNYQDRPVRAVVIRTGFNTTKGNLVRSIMFPKPNNFKFYQESLYFVGILGVIALIGFCWTIVRLISLQVDAYPLIIRALDLITIIIPPALPASMAIGTAFAMHRLKLKNIFCISPQKINISGKMNIFCFDKTGTLTEEGLDLMGMHYMEKMYKHLGSINKSIDEMDHYLDSLSQSPSFISHLQEQPAFAMLLAMTTCHSLKNVNGELIGDPLEVKMFQMTSWDLEEAYLGSNVATIVKPNRCIRLPIQSAPHTNEEDPLLFHPSLELGIIRCFEFVSVLRRMSVLVKVYKGKETIVFAKGAPENLRELCVPSSLPSNFDTILDLYTMKGYRVIALAMKVCTSLSWMKAQKLKREEVESNLQFIGLIVFENKLKPTTKSVLCQLHVAQFRTIICTGDNILTALSVAKDCNIIHEDCEIYLPRLLNRNPLLDAPGYSPEMGIVWESLEDPDSLLYPTMLQPKEDKLNDARTVGCTGTIFDYLIDHCPTEVLYRVLMNCQVFARMSPDQKQRLVECFQELEYFVGYCGDGANDCGALKAADAGISLSEAEASVAAPFTCKVPDISCTLDLIREGRSALVTSFACFKFIALYSLIECTTVVLMYNFSGNLTDFEFLYIDLIIILPIAISICWMEASKEISPQRPTARLLGKRVLTSLLGQIIIHVLMQILIYHITLSQDWYDPITVNPKGYNYENQLNTCLFLFSIFQYLIVAVIFSLNAPFQRSFVYNFPFICLTIFALIWNMIFLFVPANWIKWLFQIVHIPSDYILFLFLMTLLNAFVALVIELVGLKVVKYFLKHVFKITKHIKPYKKFLEESRRSDDKV